jgi:hypothetical protein
MVATTRSQTRLAPPKPRASGTSAKKTNRPTTKVRIPANAVRGYKIFGPGLVCNRFKYRVGRIAKLSAKAPPLKLCYSGFHFCKIPSDCFSYYHMDRPGNRYARVVALGQVVENNDKCATDQLLVEEEMT